MHLVFNSFPEPQLPQSYNNKISSSSLLEITRTISINFSTSSTSKPASPATHKNLPAWYESACPMARCPASKLKQHRAKKAARRTFPVAGYVCIDLILYLRRALTCPPATWPACRAPWRHLQSSITASDK